jgi:anti-sigma B factor antagonist
MHDQLSIKITRHVHTTVVAPSGDLDIVTAPRLAEALDRVEGDVVIDLRDVTFLDARGLRLILDHSARAHEHGRSLSVVRGAPAVHRVFELTRADRTVRIVEPSLAA